MIDLKSLDALDRHLEQVWNMQKYGSSGSVKEEWEINPHKLFIKQEIARGAFSSVYRGVYDGQDVAVKVPNWGVEDQGNNAQITSHRTELRQEDKREDRAQIVLLSLKQEASVWHKLDHPNISKFIGEITAGTSKIKFQSHNGEIGRQSNVCCLVTAYQPGGTLKSYLIKNREKKLAFKTIIQLALDLARGLNYLHSKNIVHRDVKTDNILLDQNQKLKITDFGVTRFEASNANEMTGYTGTLGYMAPEVFESKPYNRKCDVYSFGICLWEIYCCDKPYRNLSFSKLTTAVVYKNTRPEIPKCCPTSLAKVMKSCWDTDPNKRPEMEEVVSMLEAIDTSKGKGMIPLDEPPGFLCWRAPKARN